MSNINYTNIGYEVLLPMNFAILSYEDAEKILSLLEVIYKDGSDIDHARLINDKLYHLYQNLKEFVDRQYHYEEELREFSRFDYVRESL